MTPADMGRAFSYLFAYRSCSTHPEGRRRRDGEAQVAEILTSEISGYQDFEAFLNVQGFTMRSYEQAAIGVAARGQVFVMARRCTEEQAPYIDCVWLFERMRDRRSSETLEHVVVWAAQLWAMTQWFFYTRLDRGIDAVGRFKEAFINVSQLTRELQEQIEGLRTRGAPADDRGRVVWEILTDSTGALIETKARRFLAAMEEAALLDRIENEGDVQYRQTLNAAVEMSLNFERQAFYLMPDDERDGPPAEDAVLGLIEGTGLSSTAGAFGGGAGSFPDEEVDDEPNDPGRSNGGIDVGH
ncbi:hypothetical protein [Bradyrhizobium elkanii]|uniref:hypothetical protein n=1 Tax=Bradyrhizobium elkanii TaxID=29448 RepID=UPI001AE43F0B|nr:hypothetical protein [Bradyrhizobium elkanii]MBP2428858.1 hypothetical protein [Bradyrhizobium elkanii]WLA93593.1 hypothetical protein QNJ96_10095 [Bradyrhizobium elkanii]